MEINRERVLSLTMCHLLSSDLCELSSIILMIKQLKMIDTFVSLLILLGCNKFRYEIMFWIFIGNLFVSVLERIERDEGCFVFQQIGAEFTGP